MSLVRADLRCVSDELCRAVADAQEAAQRAHNLAYRERTPFLLRAALGRAQSILITWQVRLASRPKSGSHAR